VLSKIVPSAVLWYTGEANEYEDQDDDEEEEDDMQDEDDDDDDDDGDYVPPVAGAQPPECKQS
jgi:nucleosome assembly protein 1-like 1